MSATAQGRLPPALPDIGVPTSDPSDPYLMHPFQVSPGIDVIISSLVADPLMDQTLYAQAMNGNFLDGGLEAKLDSVMVSSPPETELHYYRAFLCSRFLKWPDHLARAFCSHAIFLIICESNAGGAPVCVDCEPGTTASRWGDAGVRRSLREDARSERLHRFNFGPGAGPFGGSIRTCVQLYYRNFHLTLISTGKRNRNSE